MEIFGDIIPSPLLVARQLFSASFNKEENILSLFLQEMLVFTVNDKKTLVLKFTSSRKITMPEQ